MVGQPIGTILAVNDTLAHEAASLVKVEYEDLPAVLTVRQAIEQGSYKEGLGVKSHWLQIGDPVQGFRDSDVILEGTLLLLRLCFLLVL